ncbi:YfhL family 4Fe-4S dicluster ferredoxin [Acinetobacter rudis]|uniref:YfhL family 4Fe-4S dicluster ferredoxin n=1 Tax=Acinetobacter rudis TaxID=632955 RepID=A0AAW8JAM2_9GAMM|nr:YfhL family 4Fe-4S dicluster ferredoxin [Acinetobacter rudis]MDQ8936889.1 YfhL family 4Fe-4S dicluster ferredoxin [Acinetobacter rudis]MDQ9019109.1 YfhL family 4Fe-4S dicluster ferredoxin [Acinetobacter rudis]
MSLFITDACINCDMCLAECPNQAIFEGEKYYEIDVERCTECVGFYDHQTCVAVCPIECIVPHPEFRESQEQLLSKFKALNIV